MRHCETLPDVFRAMNHQLEDAGPILGAMSETCKLNWLLDDSFSNEAKDAKAPPAGEPMQTAANCRSLFEITPGSAHSNVLAPLITMLDSIIYREGRQSPKSGS
jgi:hypothetical protein